MIGEVPLYDLNALAQLQDDVTTCLMVCFSLQGYLAHKKTPTPMNPPRTLGIGLR